MIIAIPVAIALGLLAFLLMGGAYLLGKLLASLFSVVPGIGPWIASNLESAVAWSISTIWGAINAAVRPMLSFLEAPFRAMWQFGDSVVAGFERTAGALISLVQLLQQAFARAVAYTEAGLSAAASALQQTAAALTAALGAVQAAVTHYAEQLYNASMAALQATATALQGAIAATWSATVAAIAHTQAWVAGLVQDTATGIEHEVAAVAAAGAAEAAALGRWATTAVHDVYDSLTREIDQARAESLAYTEAAAGALGAYLGTSVVPAVNTLTAEMDDCVRPYCTGLQGLGADFNALATVLTMAALLAFLTESLVDPGAVVTQVNDVAGPIADGAYTLMRDALGLRL